MVLVLEVIYRNEDKEEIVTLESIEQREDFEDVKYNIYCPTSECNCKMEYIRRGKKSAYFKKWRGNVYQHSLNCPYYADIETGKRPRKRLGIHSSRLRSDHQKNLLKDMYKKYTETKEEREIRKNKERNRAKKNRINKRVEKDKPSVEEIVNRPTTDNQGEVLLDGERNPPVPRNYSIIHIGREELNSTIALMDLIVEVENDFENPSEKRSIITLTNEGNNFTFKVILEPVFFAQSSLNVDSMLEGIRKRVLLGEIMILGAVGQVIERNNDLGLTVFSQDGLSINGKELPGYLSNIN